MTNDILNTQYFNNIKKIPLLTKKEEEEIFNKIEHYKKQNDKLQQKKYEDIIFKHNLRLVVKYCYKFKFSEDFEDLIQEGNLGLHKAIQKFDIQKGFKFSTYATYWIIHKIQNYLYTKINTVYLPTQILQQLKQLQKIEDEYFEETNTHINLTQLAQKTNLPLKQIEDLIQIKNKTYSLDFEYNNNTEDEDKQTLLQKIEDQNCFNIEKYDLNQKIEKSLLILDKRERFIVKNHFGINTLNLTFEQIGEKLNLTREGVRQIEKRALQKLKESDFYDVLKIYNLQ